MINGSYFADFNEPNNFPRAILGKSNYGLVVLPSSNITGGPEWILEPFFSGQPIGLSFLASSALAGLHRWLCLLGDPTLRYDYAKPPTLSIASRSGSLVTLGWSAGESGQEFHIYRAATTAGPFDLLTTSGALPSTQFTTNYTDNPTKRVYMIRGRHLTSTASTAFWNLSQGSVKISN